MVTHPNPYQRKEQYYWGVSRAVAFMFTQKQCSIKTPHPFHTWKDKKHAKAYGCKGKGDVRSSWEVR
jgi:hypothetical protein